MVHQPQEYRRARGAYRDPELCCTPKEVNAMAKVLVLYYSAYGHIERMAQAIAEGARSAAGTEVTLKRVPGAGARRSGTQGWHESRPEGADRQRR